jgi:putative permease
MSSKHTQSTGLNVIIVIIAVIATLFAAGSALKHTVSCFLLSFVLAYLLDPSLVLLERRNIRRIHGIVALYAVLAVIAYFFVAYLVPLLAAGWTALLREMPLYLQQVKTLMLTLKVQMLPPSATDEWLWLIQKVSGQLDKFIEGIGNRVYGAATSLVFNLFNLVLSPILVFFMLYYKREVQEFIAGWLPSRQRESILALGREINDIVGGYIRGQLIVSSIVAILATAALMFLGVDYPLFNGIFAGLSSVLPFIGVILAMLPPLFFAYAKSQGWILLLKVTTAFAVIYFLEGYLIKPLVFKKSMDLNPLATIIVVMAFGELMGFWGILLAIPIAAAFKVFAEHLRRGDFSHG